MGSLEADTVDCLVQLWTVEIRIVSSSRYLSETTGFRLKASLAWLCVLLVTSLGYRGVRSGSTEYTVRSSHS